MYIRRYKIIFTVIYLFLLPLLLYTAFYLLLTDVYDKRYYGLLVLLCLLSLFVLLLKTVDSTQFAWILAQIKGGKPFDEKQSAILCTPRTRSNMVLKYAFGLQAFALGNRAEGLRFLEMASKSKNKRLSQKKMISQIQAYYLLCLLADEKEISEDRFINEGIDQNMQVIKTFARWKKQWETEGKEECLYEMASCMEQIKNVYARIYLQLIYAQCVQKINKEKAIMICRQLQCTCMPDVLCHSQQLLQQLEGGQDRV